MPITISGSTGIAGVDGSASTPAVQGTDTNTGITFPAADTVAVATGGSERMRVDSSGNVGIGTSSPTDKLQVNTQDGVRLGASGSVSYARIGSALTGEATAQISYDRSVGATIISQGNTGSALTERMRIDASGNLLFNSGYGSVATAYGCRAWVNFNGTGVVAIRASGNVTSITDTGTGSYTVNFTNALPDANFAPMISSGFTSASGWHEVGTTKTTTTCTIQTTTHVSFTGDGRSGTDFSSIHFAVYR